MPTTAMTIKEGHRYQLGEFVIWYEKKPGEGRRLRLFVKSAKIEVGQHIDRPGPDNDNGGDRLRARDGPAVS